MTRGSKCYDPADDSTALPVHVRQPLVLSGNDQIVKHLFRKVVARAVRAVAQRATVAVVGQSNAGIVRRSW